MAARKKKPDSTESKNRERPPREPEGRDTKDHQPQDTGTDKQAPAGDKAEEPSETPFPMVAIGASAGGLEALQQFFDNMPDNNGMAFVVVTHQHPGHVSMLPDLPARHTRMPVNMAEPGEKVFKPLNDVEGSSRFRAVPRIQTIVWENGAMSTASAPGILSRG